MTESLTLAICTRNRASFLRGLLDSLSSCERFREAHVLIVDNGSKDGTDAVCREYGARFPNVRSIVEPREGLSFARNAALEGSRTSHVLFLDDDCTVPADFIRRALGIVRERDADFFGGPIIPSFRGDEPPWVRALERPKVHQAGTGFHPLGRLAGGNFGMRRALVEAIGFFDTGLGMRGDHMGVYEEKALLDRYMARTPADRRRIYYDVDLPIHHRVLPHKFKKSYHIRRAFLNGIAEARSAARFRGAKGRLQFLRKALRGLREGSRDLAGRRAPAFVVLVGSVHQAGRLLGAVLPRSREGPPPAVTDAME